MVTKTKTMMHGKTWGYVWSAVLAILLMLLLREAWHVAVDHVLVPDWRGLAWSKFAWQPERGVSNFNLLRNFNMGIYWWFAVGVAIYPLARWLLVKYGLVQKRWFTEEETHAHENSHRLVGKLLGRRIHSIHSEENTGVVTSSGKEWNRLFMTLAPYTIPYMTLFLLAFRAITVPQNAWLFDIITGSTFGFHLVCFITQTGKHQTDINRFATLWFPSLYIAVFAVFNFVLFSVTFWGSKNFFSALWWIFASLFDPTLC